MNEASRKKKLVAEVNALGGKARRHEDKYAVGLLDLEIKLPDHPHLLAEGKLIKGNLFGPTLRQYYEGVDWKAAGTEVLLIGWKGDVMAISPWCKDQVDYRQCFTGAANVSTLLEYLRTLKGLPRYERDHGSSDLR